MPLGTLTCMAMEHLSIWMKGGRGRLTKVAAACGISHSAVWQWKRIPSDRVLVVERVTGIPRTLLRPDLYGELGAAR
jgi:DNA-binding transcriptional regulator YdaS (Cro superfamily)